MLLFLLTSLVAYCWLPPAVYIAYLAIRLILDIVYKIDVKGKAVVVIGSTTGFGHDYVLKCAKKGMLVFAGCNSPSGVEILKQKCAEMPGKVFPFPLDIASQESVDEAYKFITAHLPQGQGIQALVNNAGIIQIGVDDWLTTDDYDRIWRVNTLGIIRVTKKFKELVKLAKGRIVMCSSICGRIAFPCYGPYTVSKFAMEAYSDTIRRELEPFGVKVSIVEPGYFQTPITIPSNMLGTMDKAFHNAPAEMQKAYGEDYLRELRAIHNGFLTSWKNSPHVEWVVDCYYHASVSPFPKKRYVVGIDANFIVVPIARMTADIQDAYFRLTSRIYKAPLPAILKSNEASGGEVWSIAKEEVVNGKAEKIE